MEEDYIKKYKYYLKNTGIKEDFKRFLKMNYKFLTQDYIEESLIFMDNKDRISIVLNYYENNVFFKNYIKCVNNSSLNKTAVIYKPQDVNNTIINIFHDKDTNKTNITFQNYGIEFIPHINNSYLNKNNITTYSDLNGIDDLIYNTNKIVNNTILPDNYLLLITNTSVPFKNYTELIINNLNPISNITYLPLITNFSNIIQSKELIINNNPPYVISVEKIETSPMILNSSIPLGAYIPMV